MTYLYWWTINKIWMRLDEDDRKAITAMTSKSTREEDYIVLYEYGLSTIKLVVERFKEVFGRR